MDEEYQRMASHSIAHEAWCAGQAWQQAAAAHERPCVLWKPRLFIDGNQWCALFGENIQEGVVGFGDSPDAAMREFDAAWHKKLTPLPGAQPAPMAVAYLDLGAGGYMDIGTDLTDEALAALPKGRHLLGIVGTYGVEGYIPAQPAPSVPEGFSREDLEAVADGLDGYEKTVNVGNVTGVGDDHLESTTAYAARFIRAMLAAQPAPSVPMDVIADYLVSISAHLASRDDAKAQAEIRELLKMIAAAPKPEGE